MPDQNLTLEPRLISALQSLRVALHVPEDLSGIASALSAASDCLNLAASHFYDQNLFEWKSVADDLRAAFSEQAATGSADAARWYRPSSTDGTAQSRLATWRRSVSPGELERKLSILIGRTIAAAATTNARVSPALIEGANILRNTQRGKGRRSHTWNTLLTLDLLDGTGIAHLCESIDPRAVHFSFLSAALHVLRSPIYSPYRHIQEVVTGASLDKSSIDSGLLRQPNDKETTDSDAATVPASEESPQKRDDLLPDIGSRLASSDYTSFSEKLGFVTRDYIDSDDLSLMTRQLVKHLESRNKPQSAYAVLALVSLLTGCTDFLAVKLRFEPGHSIWLNIDCSVWCWAFSAYRSKQDDPNEPATGEPISVALPGNLALRL
uniref:hypothetical protein n=1 Tax=Rhodoferax sp. OV413 TaxID=1855285 RepID=UPI0025E353B0